MEDGQNATSRASRRRVGALLWPGSKRATKTSRQRTGQSSFWRLHSPPQTALESDRFFGEPAQAQATTRGEEQQDLGSGLVRLASIHTRSSNNLATSQPQARYAKQTLGGYGHNAGLHHCGQKKKRKKKKSSSVLTHCGNQWTFYTPRGTGTAKSPDGLFASAFVSDRGFSRHVTLLPDFSDFCSSTMTNFSVRLVSGAAPFP